VENRILAEVVGLLVLSCSGQPEPGLGNSGGDGPTIAVGGAGGSTGIVGLGGSGLPTGGSLSTGGSITGFGGMTGVCAVGTANCDGLSSNGCEVDLRTDLQNCGSCGNRCGSPYGLSSCVSGICGPGDCWPFGNCDGSIANGCETNLQTSAENCGVCGVVCASGVCVAGVCQSSK